MTLKFAPDVQEIDLPDIKQFDALRARIHGEKREATLHL